MLSFPCIFHNIGEDMGSDVFERDEAILSEQWAIDGWSLAKLSHRNGKHVGLLPHCIGSLFELLNKNNSTIWVNLVRSR